MRPPICCICDTDFRDSISEGGTVQFKLTEKDIQHNKRLERTHMTGHPAGLEWFCKEHLEQAKKLQHLTLKQAKQRLIQAKPKCVKSLEVDKIGLVHLFDCINNHWHKIMALFIQDMSFEPPEVTETKNWSPMDNCYPPNCPYTIDVQCHLQENTLSVTNQYSIAYWNPNDINQASYGFHLLINQINVFTILATAQQQVEVDSITFTTDSLTEQNFNAAIQSILTLL